MPNYRFLAARDNSKILRLHKRTVTLDIKICRIAYGFRLCDQHCFKVIVSHSFLNFFLLCLVAVRHLHRKMEIPLPA